MTALIHRHPTFGYRRRWALRRRDGLRVNRTGGDRLLKRRGWLVHRRAAMPRPRALGLVSRAADRNERWSIDVTHVDRGAGGWDHLVVVIDCYDREVIGWEFALRERAQGAERALGPTGRAREGTLRPAGPTPAPHNDNGLIFQSQRGRTAWGDDRLTQEDTTPYTPEQNGVSERWFRP